MSAPELDQVEALLADVLADPGGYLDRLFEQVLTRYADAALLPDSAHDVRSTTEPVEQVVPTDPFQADVEASESDLLLAIALGACECWGADSDCPVCRGQGSSGWTRPDAGLFREYVEPAVARLSATCDDDMSTGERHRATSRETDETNRGVTA